MKTYRVSMRSHRGLLPEWIVYIEINGDDLDAMLFAEVVYNGIAFSAELSI